MTVPKAFLGEEEEGPATCFRGIRNRVPRHAFRERHQIFGMSTGGLFQGLAGLQGVVAHVGNFWLLSGGSRVPGGFRNTP